MLIVVGDVGARCRHDEDKSFAGKVAKLYLIWLSAAPTAPKSNARARTAPTLIERWESIKG